MSTDASGGSIAYGKAVQGSGSGAGIPVLSHNGFGQAITSSSLLAVPSTVVISTAAGASTGAPTLQNVGTLDLDWGRWDNAQIEVKNGASNAIPPNDVEWAVFKPSTMTGLASGTIRYGNNSSVPISGIDQTGNSLKNGVIEFDITFGLTTDAISNGSLQVFDSANIAWKVTFNGDISGAYAKMTDISGTRDAVGSVTGVIGGVFTGTTTTPDFVGGFALKSGSNFIQGISLMNNENCFNCPL